MSPGTDYDSTSRRPRRGLLIAAAVVILALVATLVWVLTRNHDDGGATTAPPSSRPTTSGSPAVSTSTCGLPDGNQSPPTTAPAAQWKLQGGFAYPTSAPFGPGTDGPGGVHSCFAHSPTGALFAAAVYFADTVRTDVTAAGLLSRIYDDQNKTIASQTMGKVGGDGHPGQQIAGFRMADATSDRVSVDLAARFTEGPKAGGYFAVTLVLGWQQGDWRIVVPPSGQPPTTGLTSLQDFTTWSGSS